MHRIPKCSYYGLLFGVLFPIFCRALCLTTLCSITTMLSIVLSSGRLTPMRRKKITGIALPLLVLLAALLLSAPAHSSDDMDRDSDTVHGTVVEFFYEIGCNDCKKARPVVEDFAAANNLSVVDYEISTASGIAKIDEYEINVVPAVVLYGQVIEYQDYGGDLGTLEDLLNQSLHSASDRQNHTESGDQANQTNLTDPTNRTDQTNQTSTQEPPIKLTIPTVFVAGLIAGFNPCLLAILAFIATVALSNEDGGRSSNQRMLWLVVVFCFGIFITYLVAGMGLLQAIGHSEGMRETIEDALIAIIVVLGIWHIYDAYHVKRYDTSSFKTSGSAMRYVEDLVKKESLPAIFVLGVLFSLVKAPCVGALYLSILKMLIRDGALCGALYLGVYNLGVISPVLILGLAITFGMQPESVSRYKDAHRSSIRLATGVLLLAIAVLMELGMV